MTILEKNIQALLSGVNEPLGNKLLNFIQNKTCSRFNIDENLNIFDKTHNVFMYENLEEEINFFYQSILEKTHRYPFICIYGIGNALLIKNLAKHYKHLFVFESEIELFILALSTIDLSEELCSGKIYLVDIEEERVDIQLLILFDMKDISEYLSLYEMFVNNVYYKKFYEDIWHKADELCEKNIKVVIRNLGSNSDLSFECYSHLLQNIPSMLESIPFQRILSQRKNKFENAIVVSAGPSLAKQLPLLKACQDKAVIFCADGALSMLEKEGIVPDYVTNLDFTDLAMKFFQNKENKTSLNILSCATYPNLVHFLDNKSVILRDDPLCQRFNLNDFGYIGTGAHVSHFSYTLALALGFKNIIMIGQDLAFDKEGNSHSKGFDFGEKFSGEENIDKLKVPAYAGKGEVLTHITWNDYRIKLEYLFACNDQKAKFYNATEGGARINFTEELSFKECCEKFLTKEKPKFELPKSLTKNRSDKLLVKFKEKIQKDQENAKRFLDDALALKQILENILSKDFILPLEFLEKVYQNIENFNHSLDEDEFIQDEVLRGAFAYRGKMIADVLKLHIQDKTHFITAYVKAYDEWLLYFMEKLGQRINIIINSFKEI
ncbi:TPA: motility associated factor glycosyltransferase family protein [Campylobacter jejuni]|uniref:motility associated factor glycosyltransferase family protein n=1 Tax=Campylobacter jejuni TaxID=197 RepID=UPI001AD6E26B|nr:motility associated factor glycosyltransferase family protein [Campylobacter jejuni]EJM0268452.1 motility associated factor glycosyltransferase family protein [Campylobacter jejuni]MBO7064566.1 motility associated factor glycosyltransferase family protein [Campylobacter jejuni]MDN2860662.1 motility associated factor glycosyltransferase family protein [Campylobacter jejuni]MDN2902906.1 motility associated factor glycosyltransferase family protein [Campylobacter jejuni]HDZ4676594.1 motility a